ncbi:MAG: hypothetical protein AAGI52_06030 [Bacteroidota bacterium]
MSERLESGLQVTGPSARAASALRTAAREDDGSAILTALVLATVSLTLAGSVLVYTVARERLVLRDGERLEAVYAAESGVHAALAALRAGDLGVGEEGTFEVAPGWEAQVATRYRGGRVELASVVGGRWSEARVRMEAAREPPEEAHAAFAFGDTLSPVTLAGRATIRGPVLTGRRGLAARTLQGRPFRGDVDGELVVRETGDPVPPVDTRAYDATLARLGRWLDALPEDPPSGLSPLLETHPAVVEERVFQPDTRVLVAADRTTVREEDLEGANGPVVVLGAGALRIAGPLPTGSTIAARGVLRVEGAARGQSLLFSGERVEVDGPTMLEAEVVARRSVRIAGGARLVYPSSVYAALETGDESDQVVIEAGTVEGTVLVPETDLGGPAAVRLRMTEDARVVGAVVALSTAEVEGQIEGSLFAQRFRFFSSPATFVNWLRDATIDVRARPEGFVVPVGVGEGPEPFVPLRREVRSSFMSREGR